ncbi:hypothetical protein HAX54_046392, partial [Datura stramonium]|nr:hypothetical protein [Datura stramonium]
MTTLKTRFHHRGAFIKNGQDTLYIGEKELVEVFDIDKDHFSMFELLFYSKDLGYLTVGGFYYKDSKTNDLLPVESDAHFFEIVKDMKNAKATNVGDINTDHEVEKDLGETENLEDINLEVYQEFGEVSEKVDVDVDIVNENEQYIEEHLDGVETDVGSSSDTKEE